MKSLQLILMFIVFGTATTLAQDWRDDAAGEAQYSCGTVRLLVARLGDEIYIRLNDTVLTVEAFHRQRVPSCWTTTPADAAVAETGGTQEVFQITVQEVVNLRECAGTNCDRVGVARPGSAFEVLGEDGDWYEISYKGGSAFIAAWLTTRVVGAPEGLLADFQFFSAEAKFPLYGHTARTGTWWLNLERADGTNTDIKIETILWGEDNSTGNFQYPQIYGWGGNDWELMPGLLPTSSFYIYLPGDEEIYEFPIADAPYVSDYQIGWNIASRPASIGIGTRIRVIVAESGQADQIEAWAAAVANSEHLGPPAKPSPPTLVAGDGQVTVIVKAAPPVAGGAPITTFELRYREAGAEQHTQLGNVNEGDFVVDNLTNGNAYQIAIAPISRGGKGPYSDWAAVTLPEASG